MQQQRRHGRRSHRRDWETGLLGFLTVFFGPDERWHKISARTIGYRLKVRTPAYSFDEVSHIAQSCRALASVRIVLSLLVHVSTLWVRTRGPPEIEAARLLRLFVCVWNYNHRRQKKMRPDRNRIRHSRHRNGRMPIQLIARSRKFLR